MNNFKRWSLAVFLLMIILSLAGCGGDSAAPGEMGLGETGLGEVVLGGEVFELELALSEEERMRGLMGRESLPENGGMLFVFPPEEPYPTELVFWMKDCLIPLDVIFLDPGGEIVAIHTMQPLPPGIADERLPRYSSGEPAQFAIEIRGGLARRLGLAPGEAVELKTEELLALAQ